MRKLGRNAGRYCGETSNVEAMLTVIRNAADQTGWHRDFFSTLEGAEILAYRRNAVAAKKCLYLSAGIHGDEPAGPLAVAELLQQNQWPDTVEISLCPCLNPTGLALNTRENAAGIDLNRDYRHLNTAAVRSHVAWLQQQPNFDVAVCLHEDWEAGGFYVYEVNPDGRPSLAGGIIKSAELICPIETSATVDGWEVEGGIIRPNKHPLERPEWPEALFLIMNKTRLVYTLEAPSDFPLATRVQTLIAGVRSVLDHLSK